MAITHIISSHKGSLVPRSLPPRRGRGLGTRLLIKDALRVLGGRFQLPDGLAEALVLCFQNLLVLKRREMVYTAAYDGGFFEAQ